MSPLLDAAVIAAVVVLVVFRQLRAQQVGADRRWWLIPCVMAFLSVRQGGLVDPHHPGTSVLLLVGELVVGLVMGAAWATTSRIWKEPDGTVWARGTKATVAAWVIGIALRIGLVGLGTLAGIHQGTGAVLLALAVSLLMRSMLLMWRARSVSLPFTGPAAYGGGVSVAMRKDRV
ncbi:DUF1453 domain-containing protein [Streptomyces sp. NPDC002004]